MKTALGCMGLIFVWVASIPFNGLVIAILWTWFIVPVFHVSTIGIAQAVGLSCFVTAISPVKPEIAAPPNDDNFGAVVGKAFGTLIAAPFGALLFALVWRVLFMP